jgi:hypothetical protein
MCGVIESNDMLRDISGTLVLSGNGAQAELIKKNKFTILV